MRKVIALIKAVGGFVAAFFRARPRAATYSPNGHMVLTGWETCPEEAIVSRVTEVKPVKPAPRFALHCHQGPHAGQTIFLGKSLETLSRFTDATAVITPADGQASDRYRLLINGHITMVGESGSSFSLNGQVENKAELFDYDELEVLGNKFLVLTLNENGDHV